MNNLHEVNQTMSRRVFVRGAVGLSAVVGGRFLTGCNQADAVDKSTETVEGTPEDRAALVDVPTESRPLVIYFTNPEPTGVDTVAGASRVARDGRVWGNNELVAALIQQQTGADVFAIETVQTYPTDHDELIEFGVAEQEAETLPELVEYTLNIADYDTVFFGFPVWNAQLPMPVRSLLAEIDLSGKDIYPFTVHGGSGFASTLAQLREAQPDAHIRDEALAISRNDAWQCDETVAAWLGGLGYPRRSAEALVAPERTLVAYFSHTGITRAVAQDIQSKFGCDLFEIVPETPYPEGTVGAACVAEGIDASAEGSDADAWLVGLGFAG